MHIRRELQLMLVAGLIGMVFAFAYYRSGSLWTPVIAHAIFNGVSFAVTIAGVNS